MQDKYGFIYLWYDRKRKMYYIGCHWGTTDDGYICSSRRMRDVYRRRPEDFKRRILAYVYSDKQTLFDEEYKWLSKIPDDMLGKKYYNLKKWHCNHWTAIPDEERKKSIRQKLSESNSKPFPPERTRLKGRKISEEARQNRIGLIRSEEHKANLSKAGFGRQVSEETRQKLRQSNLHKYEFISPEGNKVVVDNLLKFCSEHAVGYHQMINLYNGKYYKESYKGWRRYE